MEDVMDLQPNSIRWLFFVVGIVATIAYRIIIILNFYSPTWVQVSWYIGTIGFIFYFGYLYKLQHNRSRLVLEYDLLDVVEKIKGVEPKQKQALRYVIKSNATSKAKWNSAIIFILSFLALIAGIAIDLWG